MSLALVADDDEPLARILDRQNNRDGKQATDYLALAAESKTVSKKLSIRKAAERLKGKLPECVTRLPIYERDQLLAELEKSLPNPANAESTDRLQYFNQLLDDTDPHHLMPPEPEASTPAGKKDDWQSIDSDSMLVSQRVLRAYQAKRQHIRNDRGGKTREESNLKSEHLGYRRFTLYGLQLESKFADSNEADIKSGVLTEQTRNVDPASLVITLGVFPPRQKGLIARQSTEIRVLHTTPLVALFDRIHCPHSQVSLRSGTEFAENPDIPVTPTVKERFPNAFLFCGDTFYYDDRVGQSVEVASQVREWVHNHQVSVPKPCKLVPIMDIDGSGRPVQIQDLEPSFGYPYLFQHANDCEHLFVFMDIRVLNPDDPQDENTFPFLTNKPNPRRTVCKACNLHSAKWETREDEMSDEDPSFWCDVCFRMFHYDKDKKPTHSFLAKPFIDPAIMYSNLDNHGLPGGKTLWTN